MLLVKIILIAVFGAVAAVFIKKNHPEIALLLSVATGLVILLLLLGYLSETFVLLKNIVSLSGIDGKMFLILLKITAVCYIVEFAATAIKDLNENSLAEKVVLAGKLVILTLSIPIIEQVVSLFVELLGL